MFFVDLCDAFMCEVMTCLKDACSPLACRSLQKHLPPPPPPVLLQTDMWTPQPKIAWLAQELNCVDCIYQLSANVWW